MEGRLFKEVTLGPGLQGSGEMFFIWEVKHRKQHAEEPGVLPWNGVSV